MVLRRLGKATVWSGVGINCINVGMVAYSYFGEDGPQKSRLKEAEGRTLVAPASGRSSGFWSYFSGSGPRALSDDERACVDAMTNLMSFQKDTLDTTRHFTPNVVLNDTLVCFDGISEMRDGWHFLAHFFKSSSPLPVDIRRDVDVDGGVVLHVAYETEAVALFDLVSYTFKSHVTLVLDNGGMGTVNVGSGSTASASSNAGTMTKKAPAGSSEGSASAAAAAAPVRGLAWYQPPRIAAVEHRWFCGPILSRMTSTQENVLGDAGDLLRRLNGFVMSLFLTKI